MHGEKKKDFNRNIHRSWMCRVKDCFVRYSDEYSKRKHGMKEISSAIVRLKTIERLNPIILNDLSMVYRKKRKEQEIRSQSAWNDTDTATFCAVLKGKRIEIILTHMYPCILDS